MRNRLLGAFFTFASCGDDDGAGAESEAESESESEAFAPDHACPGDPDCPDQGDGVLLAGAAARDVTPRDFETWIDVSGDASFGGRVGRDDDCPLSAIDDDGNPVDCERDCTASPGDTCDSVKGEDCFHDADGDGCFDAVWIAGFGGGRAANGVAEDDGIGSRCVVLSYNATRVALCAVDFVGYFLDEVDSIRAALDPAWQVDLLLVSATHVHEGPDTIGIWGPNIAATGINRAYNAFVRAETVAAVGEAVAALRPVGVTYGSIETADESGVSHFVSDTRDPIIFTPELHAFRFADAKSDETVATLINWAAHPEYTGPDNVLLSSDFPHWVRRRVEGALGGIAVYVSGPLGGQVGPGDVCALDPETDEEVCDSGPRKARLVGEAVGDFALRALGSGSVSEDTAPLAFRSERTTAQVQNTFYHAAGQLGVFDRSFQNYDPGTYVDFDVRGTPLGEVGEGNIPDLETEVVSLRIGRAHIITAPGELHPELFLGCYDGSCSYDWEIVTPGNPNPPDLDRAPPPPYLIDLLDADADYRMVFGLTPDMLGYIMPLFNYELDHNLPYILQPAGDHYEETNSIGPTAETQVVGTMRRLLCWREDGTASEACRQLAEWGWTPPFAQ